MKKHIQYELIWPFIKNGGIQRAGLKAGTAPKVKKYLRSELFEKYYDGSINEVQLYTELDNLCSWLVEEHKPIQKEYFGNAQKLVNLTLKSMWIAGWLKSPPPHFPVDRVIQKAIDTRISYHEPYTWTNMSRDAYKKIIAASKRKESQGSYGSNELDRLAEWEVEVYYILMGGYRNEH